MQLNISPERKAFINTFLLVILYAAGFFALQYFLYAISIVPIHPTSKNLVMWDGGYYKTLAETWYNFKGGDEPNMAFFPLFPLIWKLLHLNVAGACILNILFFATGFSILCNLYQPSTRDKILWLSIPAVYFTFIPYTEALFFMLASIVIYGIKKEKKWVIWISLFLLSLTRATGVFLAPAFLAMTLLSSGRDDWYRGLLKWLYLYLAPIIAGTAVFVIYEYIHSGHWLAFFLVQKEYWGHELRVPILPFNSYAGPPLLWISALSMFTGFFSFFFLLKKFFKWLGKNEQQDKLLIASCVYLMMAMLVVILYSPPWSGGRTTVSGMFRYSVTNPFFFIFLYHFTNKTTYTWKNYLFVFLLANILWLSFGSYMHIRVFLYYTTDTILLFMYMLYSNKKLTWPAIILTALNILFQVHFFQQFIGGHFLPE